MFTRLVVVVLILIPLLIFTKKGHDIDDKIIEIIINYCVLLEDSLIAMTACKYDLMFTFLSWCQRGYLTKYSKINIELSRNMKDRLQMVPSRYFHVL